MAKITLPKLYTHPFALLCKDGATHMMWAANALERQLWTQEIEKVINESFRYSNGLLTAQNQLEVMRKKQLKELVYEKSFCHMLYLHLKSNYI